MATLMLCLDCLCEWYGKLGELCPECGSPNTEPMENEKGEKFGYI